MHTATNGLKFKSDDTTKKIPVLHAVVSGQAHKPVVVLLHGYLASSAYWQHVVEDLSITNRVVSIDLLGFGKSPKPGCSAYDYAAQTRSINHTLQNMGITGKFTLIGHSMGSLIALRYASIFPQQVKKLMLANMPVFLNKRQAKQEIMGGNLAYRIGLKPGLHWIIWPLFKIAMRWDLIPETVSDNARARRSYIFQNTSISRLRSMRNVIYAATIEADLRATNVSTLILSGLHDRAKYLQNIAELQFKKQVRVLNIPGGHHLPLTHPQLVSEFVRG